MSAVIINADSMQLYKGMDVGTAKLPESQRQGIAHLLLDVWPVTHTASVAEYQSLARTCIDTQPGPSLLVGGSGLYLRAVLDDLDFPGTNPDVRQRLEHELEAHGEAALRQTLIGLDPIAAAAIPPGNGRRVVRALEVIEITGAPFSANLPSYDRPHYPEVVQIGLRLEGRELDRRIEQRVDRMLEAGLVDEVRELEKQGLREGVTASRALGYKEILEHLDGAFDLKAARGQIVANTRRFARRQQKWFRRDPRIVWLDAASPLEIQVEHAVSALRL